MLDIIIDEEFKSLLPALDTETYTLLEENIIENGCRDSLILWNDVLIDGHNRYEICLKHGLPFNTVQKEFSTREDALIWIISTQVSRRNLTPIQLSHFRGLHYNADKKLRGGNRSAPKEQKTQNGPFEKSTAERLAAQYKVSRNTVKRDAKIADAIVAIGGTSPEAKRMILSGEAKIDKKELEELSSMPKDKISAVALEIEESTYEKKKDAAKPLELLLSGIQRLETTISKLSSGIDSELPKITKKADRTGLKKMLKSHIDRLEALYRRM
jgi:hypothetical protein